MDYVFTVRRVHPKGGSSTLFRCVSGATFPYLVSAWCRDGWFYYIVDRSWNNQFLAKDVGPIVEYAPCIGETVAFKHLGDL